MARSTLKLLTEAEAAEQLRIAASTLARVRRAGRIPHLKIAKRSYRYTREMLDDYVRVCRVEPSAWIVENEKQQQRLAAIARRVGAGGNGESHQDNPWGQLRAEGVIGAGIFRRRNG